MEPLVVFILWTLWSIKLIKNLSVFQQVDGARGFFCVLGLSLFPAGTIDGRQGHKVIYRLHEEFVRVR